MEVYHYIFRSASMVCYVSVGHVRATEVLGTIVAVITGEQVRHSRGSGNSRSVPTTSVLFLDQQEEPEKNTSSKAMDTLGVMIAVVPVVRTTGLGDL